MIIGVDMAMSVCADDRGPQETREGGRQHRERTASQQRSRMPLPLWQAVA